MEIEKIILDKLSLSSFEEFISKKMDEIVINSQQEVIAYFITTYFEFIKFIQLIELSRRINISSIPKAMIKENPDQNNNNEKEINLSISKMPDIVKINLEFQNVGLNANQNNVIMNLIIFSVLIS